MEKEFNAGKIVLISIGVFCILIFAMILGILICHLVIDTNTNVSEEAVHSDGISVECPYCGKRAKLVLEIDEK